MVFLLKKRPHASGAYSYVRTFNFAFKFDQILFKVLKFVVRVGVKGLPFETAQCAGAPARENGTALTPSLIIIFLNFGSAFAEKKESSWLGCDGSAMLYRGALIYRGCLHKVNPCCVGFGWVWLGWFGLGCVGLGWVMLCWVGLVWVGLD